MNLLRTSKSKDEQIDILNAQVASLNEVKSNLEKRVVRYGKAVLAMKKLKDTDESNSKSSISHGNLKKKLDEKTKQLND